MITCTIKENSFLAKLAAKKLKVASVAIVIGKTIHLHHASREEFLAKKKWVRHELAHVNQFQKHGFLNFLFQYVMESVRVGYFNNKFEIEARQAEEIESIDYQYQFE
jgi:hypothetical protein